MLEPNPNTVTPPPAVSSDMAGAPGSPSDTSSGAQATPNDASSNSNQPDADTQAGSSIPKALINNPSVPTQQMATKVDLNKTSTAPKHSELYNKAIEMTGGQRYTTTIDGDGNTVRTPIQPKPWALGLALALDVLSGGMAGAKAGAGQPGQAFENGAEVADKQRAAVKQSNADEDAKAKSDFRFKQDTTEANMRIYQTAVNVGNSTKAVSQQFSDSFKPISEGIQDGTIALPEGVTKDEAFETDAMAAIKNGKTNVTKDMMIPVGDPQPVMDANGQQKTNAAGIPVWGHNYVTIHGADKFQTTLTKDMQDKLHEIGEFQQDGKNADIGEPKWSFPDIMNKMSVYASVKAGEQLLTDHKNDAHDMLGRAPEDLDNLATAVKNDPAMRKAVSRFAQAQMGTAGGNSHIEEILGALSQHDPQSASTLMRYLKLTTTDLDAMHNARDAEKKKATQELNPDKQPIPAAQYASMAADIKAAHPELPATRIAMLVKRVNPQSNFADYKEVMNTADKEGNAAIGQQDRKNAQADREVAQSDARIAKGEKPVVGVDANNHQVLVPAGDVNKYGLTQVREVGQAENEKITNARGLMTVFSNVDPDDQGLIQLAQKLSDEGKLGPVASNLQNWLNKGGSVATFDAAGDSDVQRLFTKLGLSTTGLMQVHVGARGSAQMLEHFQDLADAKKLSPQAFMAALDVENKYIRMKAMLPGQEKGAGTTSNGSTANSVGTPQFRRDPQTKAVQKSTDGGKSWK